DMLVDLVVIQARIYVRMRSLPFPSFRGIGACLTHLKFASLKRLAAYLPVLGVPSGVVAAWALRSDQQSATTAGQQAVTSRRLWTLVQLTIFSLLFFFKGWVRAEPLHMALSIVPSLII